jgi:hypothetical protein
MDWIGLAQDRDQFQCSCEHGDEPSGSINGWEVLDWLHNLAASQEGLSS